eukprot:1147540-Pelagomonas_calceolata.AAC.7
MIFCASRAKACTLAVPPSKGQQHVWSSGPALLSEQCASSPANVPAKKEEVTRAVYYSPHPPTAPQIHLLLSTSIQQFSTPYIQPKVYHSQHPSKSLPLPASVQQSTTPHIHPKGYQSLPLSRNSPLPTSIQQFTTPRIHPSKEPHRRPCRCQACKEPCIDLLNRACRDPTQPDEERKQGILSEPIRHARVPVSTLRITNTQRSMFQPQAWGGIVYLLFDRRAALTIQA